MATRSRIAIRNADGTYTSIYCHWDGYPSHNGQILHDHYNTEEAVRKLLARGDLYGLAEDLEDSDTIEGRVAAEHSVNLVALKALTQACGGEWLYIFTGQVWLCAEGGFSAFGLPSTGQPEGFKPVTEWLNKE